MASTKTVVVAFALVAVFAQLSAASCRCSCSRGIQYSSDSDDEAAGYAAGSDDSDYSSSSSGSSEVETGAVSSTDDTWQNIPSSGTITYSSPPAAADTCDYCEIRVPSEAPRAIGIVQSRPTSAQHLSYGIEVPAETPQPCYKPSYHSVNVHVPVRAPKESSFAPLPYSVEVPVEQPCSCRMQPLNVQIAVPVKQRVVDTRLHSSYTVEVPAPGPASTRLTNLQAQVDRIVLPRSECCLPPNNGPAPVTQVQYVAVPAQQCECISPVGLLGLRNSAPAPAPVSYESSGSSDSYQSTDDSDSRYVAARYGRESEESSEEEEEGAKLNEGADEAPSVIMAGALYKESVEDSGCHRKREGRRKRDVDSIVGTLDESEVVGEKGNGKDGLEVLGDGDVVQDGIDKEGGEGNDVEGVEEEEDQEISEENETEAKDGEGEETAEGGEGDVEDVVGGGDVLEPELAGTDNAEGEDAGALNKRMCNSQSMRRSGSRSCGGQRRGSGGGSRMRPGSKISTSVRAADDCPKRDCPMRFYLDTYGSQAGQASPPQRPACSCSSGPRSRSSNNPYGSSCSFWRPSSASRAGRTDSSCGCGSQRPSGSYTPTRQRRPSRRQGSGEGCSSSGREEDAGHMVISPYVIPENAVRSLLRQGSSCDQSRRSQPGYGYGRRQSSRIVNKPMEYCADCSSKIMRNSDDYDQSRAGPDEYDDYYDEDEYYDDYEEEGEQRDLSPAPSESMQPAPCANMRRRGYHDLARAAQRELAENSACVGPQIILVHNVQDGLAPLNRVGMSEQDRAAPCDQTRALTPTTGSCETTRDLPTSGSARSEQSCSGAAMPMSDQTRSLPSCDQTRSMPSCSETRSMPSCDQTRNMPSCDQTRSMPSCDQTRSMPSCDQTRSMPSCDQTRSMPSCSETRIMPSCDQTRSMPSCDQTRSMPSCDQTRSMPSCDQTRSMPSCDQTRSMPSCSEDRASSPAVSPCDTARALPSSPCESANSPPSCGAARSNMCEAVRMMPTSTFTMPTCTCAMPCSSGRVGDPSAVYVCPVCGKSLREEHVDHIYKCLQEQRENNRARCSVPDPMPVIQVQPQTIMIPFPMMRTQVTQPEPSQQQQPCQCQQQPCQCQQQPCQCQQQPCQCQQNIPACDPTSRSSQPSSEVNPSWVKEWVEQISRALATNNKQGACITCGDYNCGCRGQRSLKPEDIPEDLAKELPKDLRENLPEEVPEDGPESKSILETESSEQEQGSEEDEVLSESGER